MYGCTNLKPPQGVWEAPLDQAYKPSVIGAILSVTYRFVMELLRVCKVYKLGEDEVLKSCMAPLSRPPSYIPIDL